MIYIAMMASSVLLIYLSGNCRGILRLTTLSLGLFLPCLLAGVRDPEIGTDIYSYAIWMFQDALHTSFFPFLQLESSLASPLWNVMTWLASRLGGTFEFYLFTIEAFCVVPVYLGLRRFCRGYEWAGLLVWLLLFYAFSLNGMRQSIAMSIVFYSFAFVKDRAFLKFTACIAIAMLFHQTAAIGIALYPFARLAERKSTMKSFFGRWQGFVLLGLILAAFVVAIAFGRELVIVASVLKESYSYQVQHLGSRDVSLSYIYLLAICLITWAMSKNDFQHKINPRASTQHGIGLNASTVSILGHKAEKSEILSHGFHIAAIFSCVGCLIWQLNFVSDTLGRLGAYGSIFICAMAAILMANGKQSRGHAFFLIAFCIVYFVVAILFLGKEGVFPYSSKILGIIS